MKRFLHWLGHAFNVAMPVYWKRGIYYCEQCHRKVGDDNWL